MPEGPSILILKEAISHFEGKKILSAKGNAKIEMAVLKNKMLRSIKTWGKQLLLCLDKKTIRIHLLMFGSYSVDEQLKPDRSLRLHLTFTNGSLYFYSCSVRIIDGSPDLLYNWEADVLSKQWNPAAAKKKLKEVPEKMVCDAILDQQIFSGAGNIIKNEVLYRIKIHPETLTGNLPARKLTVLINEVRNYSFDFLEWKKKFELKKHWLAHTRKTCQRCKIPLIKKYCGITMRRTFYCENCQVKYK
jgi:endonuclease-8